MFDTLALKSVDRLETYTGENADYLRDMVRHGSTAYLKFLFAMPLANHRKTLPKDAWHLARLVATRHEDCGPCVQIVVNMALADGVPADDLRRVLDGEIDQLAEPGRSVCRLAEAVVQAAPEATTLAEEIAASLGRGALVDVGMAVAGARMFPTLKRSLGHARSCSQVELELEPARA